MAKLDRSRKVRSTANGTTQNKQQKANILFRQGLEFHQKNQLGKAKLIYEQVLVEEPAHFDAMHLLGVIFAQTNLHDHAVKFIKRSISLNPSNATALLNLGNAYMELAEPKRALENYERALRLDPGNSAIHCAKGNSLRALNILDQALDSYQRAANITPNLPEIHNNIGKLQLALKRYEAALPSLNQAIALNPNYADAYVNRGAALIKLKRIGDALLDLETAISMNPDFSEAHLNYGNAMRQLKLWDRALESYNKAISIQPQFEAHYNRGRLLEDLRKFELAIENYEAALSIRPDYEYLPGMIQHNKLQLCDWSDLSKHAQSIIESLGRGIKISTPFCVFSLTDKGHCQLQASQTYANHFHPEVESTDLAKNSAPNKKIRVGYYSADFHDHATAHLMAELFESHDVSRFEFYAFSFGPDRQDTMRTRLRAPFHRFIDVLHRSDREVAVMSRELGIDIAVDLKGYTQDGRTGIFAHRCAPVQVNYLGYPGTMGAPYIDYIIADKTIIPPESQQYYSEQVVYMPHSYQVNDSKRKISERVFSKQELGLPEAGFVFCCFNNNYKILPETFDGWMRLLKAVDGSVLWLLADNPTAVSNLRKEARARGVDPDRLVFAPRMPLDEHLARHRLADLFVDTFPCNAHTTASDALWAGLPVLTRMGQSFASRVAGSLLNAMDLPELITESQEHYEQRALELALNPDLLKQIKEKLARNRLTSPLFNAKLFARHLEAAYAQMYRRYLDGQEPDVIDVQALAYRMD